MSKKSRNRRGRQQTLPQRSPSDLGINLNGVVKWFNDEKGYGFITPDDGKGDVFVHYKNIVGSGRRSLQQGDRVTLDIVVGNKGVQATNVFLS